MDIFNVISLFGGLAMFLYGMRLMGDGLKEGSSGTLRSIMEKATNNPIKAFLLGLGVTAVIQSSTATIVITSGLVGAGILTLHQSLGIIVGANVGTTVTGQIIRLLDLNADGAPWLRIFQPSTLAPAAMILGIVLLMFVNRKNSRTIGNVAIGFGILFTGLLDMTASVSVLNESGAFNGLLGNLGDNPVIGYLIGALVAFILQSSSASIGILQAFAGSGILTFRAVYAVIVGIYLGDCVTTAIVCAIGAKADAKRVGIVHVLYGIGKSILIFAGIFIGYHAGWLNSLWNETVNASIIANTNTIFNLASAIVLLPFMSRLEKLSRKIVKDDENPAGKYDKLLESLSPAFFNTPALALQSSYEVLKAMLNGATKNIKRSFELLRNYDQKTMDKVNAEEDQLDRMNDAVCEYLVKLSPHLKEERLTRIVDEYYKMVTSFERLGDHALNLAQVAESMSQEDCTFSSKALKELDVLESLLKKILEYANIAFEKRDVDAAKHIEPLEEVMDDCVALLPNRHLDRMKNGECTVDAGTSFLDVLSNVERISDICSNIGLDILIRVDPALENRAHAYINDLHTGKDEFFNREYALGRKTYFDQL